MIRSLEGLLDALRALPAVASLAEQYDSLGHLRDRDLALLAGAAVLDAMSGSILVPLLPAYAAETGAGPFLIGVIFAAPSATRALLSPVAGRVSDRFDRRRLVWTGMILGALSVVALGVVRSPLAFVALRGLDGAANAMKAPATTAYVGDSVPAEERGAAMGAYRTASMLGLAVGPAVGGALALAGGPSTPFVVLGAATLGAGVLLALRLRPADGEPGDHERAGGGARSLDAAELRTLATGSVLALATSSLISQVGTGAMSPLLAPLLARTVDAGPGYAGLAWSAFGLAMLVATPVGGTVADRRGRKPLVVGGKVVWAAVAVGLAAVTVPEVPPILLFAGGVASGASGPALSALQYESAPDGHEGTILGLYSATHAAGMALGPLLGGAVAGRFGVPGAFVGMGVLWALDTGTIALGVGDPSGGEPSRSRRTTGTSE